MTIFLRRWVSMAHRLQCTTRGSIWNAETFGKCQNLHGHTLQVEVEIRGDVDREKGMVISFTNVKEVIDLLDHKYANEVIELPTVENVIGYYMLMIKKLGSFDYIRVRVYESENSYAEDICEEK